MLSALGLLLVGQQCLNGQCYAPSAPMIMQPQTIQQQSYSASPAYQWIKVNYQGLTPYVWGYRLSNGMFRWDTALPANIDQVNRAKASVQVAPNTESVKPDTKASQRFRVTVIGTAAECAPVIKDLATHKTFKDVRDIIDAQDYRPGDWAVSAALGFNNTGKPSILVQTEDGKAIGQASDYRHGPESISQVIHQAVRRRDPAYDARKVPDVSIEPEKKKPDTQVKASVVPETKDTEADEPPAKHKACPLGFTKADYPEIAAASAVIGLFYLKRRRM